MVITIQQMSTHLEYIIKFCYSSQSSVRRSIVRVVCPYDYHIFLEEREVTLLYSFHALVVVIPNLKV